MNDKMKNNILNKSREEAIIFVKDFRVMQYNEFIKKHKLSSTFAAELLKLVETLISKNKLTSVELAK